MAVLFREMETGEGLSAVLVEVYVLPSNVTVAVDVSPETVTVALTVCVWEES